VKLFEFGGKVRVASRREQPVRVPRGDQGILVARVEVIGRARRVARAVRSIIVKFGYGKGSLSLSSLV